MGDISKTAFVVLFVVVILVSTIGTLAVLSTVDNAVIYQKPSVSSSSDVSVEVTELPIVEGGGDVNVIVEEPLL